MGSTPTPGTPTRFASCCAGGRARSLDHSPLRGSVFGSDPTPGTLLRSRVTSFASYGVAGLQLASRVVAPVAGHGHSTIAASRLGLRERPHPRHLLSLARDFVRELRRGRPPTRFASCRAACEARSLDHRRCAVRSSGARPAPQSATRQSMSARPHISGSAPTRSRRSRQSCASNEAADRAR